jgi:hypothetical protein
VILLASSFIGLKLYWTLFIKTLQNFVYKTCRNFGKCTQALKTKENLKDVKLAQTRCQKLSIQQPTTCNRPVVAMEVMF